MVHMLTFFMKQIKLLSYYNAAVFFLLYKSSKEENDHVRL